MHSYRMGETVNLNQLPPNAAPVDYSTRPYPNWGRILSTENLGFANYQALVGTRGNRVLVSAIYQLPVGRSRTFWNHMNAIGDAVLGEMGSEYGLTLGDWTLSHAHHESRF